MRFIDMAVLVVYFGAMAAMGPYFAKRTKTTEGYFLGNRSYAGWLIGISMFATSISSITFVAYPADAFKTAYLRLLPGLMLPIGVLIAAFVFLPFFRRARVTSVFEYLESRFGPKTRLYAAFMFLFGQAIRLSMILYLVSLLMEELTGWDRTTCILLGGSVTAFYTVLGGIEAVIWTDFVQSIVLVVGGLLCLAIIVVKLPGGFGTIISTALADGKFMLGDLNKATGQLEPAPWYPSLMHKTVFMMLLIGLNNWLTEYSSNQNVIQKYCVAKSAKEARKAMWICVLCSVPTWIYFMFLGTSLYVFYKVMPTPETQAMLSGAEKAEKILPYFITHMMPQGVSGLVIAGVLAAAMSSLSSSINAMSAVGVVDIYRRHISLGREDTHYVTVAKALSIAAAAIMIVGAFVLAAADSKTLQDTATELAALTSGGLLGLYLLGFVTKRASARAIGVGILFSFGFTCWMAASKLGWLPESLPAGVRAPIDNYYTGIVANSIMFALGYFLSSVFPKHEKDLRNLTVFTQDRTPLD